MREVQQELGRLPKNSDRGISGIKNAAQEGKWSELGINSWNDLLFRTFGEINAPSKIYKGKEGLEFAQNILQNLCTKLGRLPTHNDKGVRGIPGTTSRGTWKEFGIRSWNDLLEYTFGEINSRMNVYIGRKRLTFAQKEMRAFKEKHGRIPKTIDKGMWSIPDVINRGEWKEWGIDTWNHLLELTFGEINVRSKIYVGKKGLELAQEELKGFYSKYKRLPISTDEGMGGMVRTTYRGE